MKVSIIMSVLNRENMIKECMDSVLNQTFSDFEFIIIDDGSTDKSIDIIESYKDDRIKLIKNNKTYGLTKNLNYALSISQGEFIARMDDDDICYPTRIQKQVEYLETHKNIDIVFTKCKHFGALDNFSMKIIDDDDYIKSLLCIKNCIYHSAVMFRKNTRLVYDQGYLKAQDYEFWSRLILTDFKFGYIDECLLKYRIHPNQTNKSVQDMYARKILKRNYDNLFDNFDEDLYKIHTRLLKIDEEKKILTKKEIKYFIKNFKPKFNSIYNKKNVMMETIFYCKRNGLKLLMIQFLIKFLIVPSNWIFFLNVYKAR